MSRDTQVVGDAPRRCIWFHPVAGKTVRLEWPEAPTGTSVVVDYGFQDQMTHNRTSPSRVKPATLRLRRGDKVLGERRAEGVFGWHRWRVDDAGEGPLFLEATTESTVDAHLCLDLTVRRAP